METEVKNAVQRAVKNWWLSVIIGIVSIGLGVWCYSAPNATLLALTVIFVVGFAVSGLFNILFALTNRKQVQSWVWTFICGLVDLFIAYVVFTNKIPKEEFLVFYIGFWMMFQAFWSVGIAVQLHGYKINGWDWPFFFGILGVIFSFILIFKPAFALSFIVLLISISFIMNGIIKIHYGIMLRKVKRQYKIV